MGLTDPKHPTNPEWIMFDPLVKAPPTGVELLVLTEGGVLVKSPWRPEYKAWAFKPKVPDSVKSRMDAEFRARSHLGVTQA